MKYHKLDQGEFNEFLLCADNFCYKLKECLHDFTEFIPFFDENYLRELKEMQIKLKNMPSEKLFEAQGQQFSEMKEELLSRARMVIRATQEAVYLAFESDPRKITAFGFQEFYGEGNRRERVMRVLGKLIPVCREYRESLQKVAFGDAQWLELQELRYGLNRLNRVRRNYLKNRAIKLQEKKLLLNSLSERLEEINRAAQVIYHETPQRLKWFELPQQLFIFREEPGKYQKIK